MSLNMNEACMGRQKKWLRKNITSLQPDATVAQGYIMSLLEKAFVIKCLNKSKDHIEQKLLKKKKSLCNSNWCCSPEKTIVAVPILGIFLFYSLDNDVTVTK